MKIKNNIQVLLATIFCLSIVRLINAQTNAKQEIVASQALKTFKKLVTPDNYKSYGISSMQVIGATKLGSPISVRMIKLDDLKKYSPGDEKNAITVVGKRVIYPLITADNIIISSAELDSVEGKWETRSFGNRQTIKTYTDILKKTNNNMVKKTTYLVRVPSLTLNFIAEDNGENVFLTYIGEQPINEISKGQKLLLKDVLRILRPIAEKYNGLPR